MGINNEIYKKYETTPASIFGVNFLSYNYITENVNEAVTDVFHAYYFNGYVNKSLYNESIDLMIDPSNYIYKDAQHL